jgi:hypothetical protein
MERLRDWLRDGYPIRGSGAYAWGDLYREKEKPKPLRQQFLHFFRGLIWSSKPEKSNLDLISPRLGRNIDPFSRWLAKYVVPLYKRLRKITQIRPSKAQGSDLELGDPFPTPQKPEPLMTDYEDRMQEFSSSIATVMACLLPTVAIVVLANLHTTAEILGTIGGFTAAFAIGLIILTNAGRVEIFTTTSV